MKAVASSMAGWHDELSVVQPQNTKGCPANLKPLEECGFCLARADLDEGSTEGCAKRGTYEKRCVLDLTMHASIKAAPAECLNACARTAILVNGKEPTNQTINII